MAGLIAQDWIEHNGGAERVLDSLVTLFPEADVYCLWNDHPDRYPGRTVRESPLAHTVLRGRKAAALPVMPACWHALPNHGYEWTLSCSHLFAHHLTVRGLEADRQFVYTHTPARYLWAPELDPRGQAAPVRAVAPVLRAADRARGRHHRHVAANSAFVRERIGRAWHVEAQVIHPPVQVDELTAGGDWAAHITGTEADLLCGLPEPFVLGASRFVRYKRLDIVIEAGRAAGLPVVIAGRGPEERALRAHATEAGADVRFVIAPSDALLRALMQRALVYVFPPIEDFGIMPVEAQALGTPVVVNAVGGAVESASVGVTGIPLHAESPVCLREALYAAAELDPGACVAQAAQFSQDVFQQRIADWMGMTKDTAEMALSHTRHTTTGC